MAAFSTPELIAMARFNKIFDDVLNSASLREEAPEIEDLLKRPEWSHIIKEAAKALEVFERDNNE